RVRRLVSSPELTASLDHLDRALAGLDTTIRVAGPEIGPTIAQLRRTADGLDATATSAERLVGDTPRSPSGNLQQTLRELGEAARAIRTLAEYLDQHPEALLRGRSP